MLEALVVRFGGGPVGVATLAVAVGEEPNTVEEVCEPFLVRAGLLARTARGRVATEAAWRHLGQPLPRGGALLGGAGGAISGVTGAPVHPGCVVRAPVRRIDSAPLARNSSGRGRARPVRSPARAVHQSEATEYPSGPVPGPHPTAEQHAR